MDNTNNKTPYPEGNVAGSSPLMGNVDGGQAPPQNKYPKFDVGGDNFANNSTAQVKSPPSEFSSQENTDDIAPEPLSVQTAPPTPVNLTGSGGVTATSFVSDGSPVVGYASIKRRYFATFIDGLIVSVIQVILNLPSYITQMRAMSAVYSMKATNTGYGANIENDLTNLTNPSVSNPIYSILAIIGIIFSISYYVFFIGKSGATPGKKLLKIKVVDKETQKSPGYLKALLRETVGKFVSGMVFGIGYVAAIKDKDRQAWHDKIAGTVVITS